MAAIVSGMPFQIGCVVDDLDRAERDYATSFGVGEWSRIESVRFPLDRTFVRGEPADFAFDVSLGYAGDQQIELIRPRWGVNIYTEYLQRCGPGVHHLGWIPEDFQESVRRAREAGYVVAQQGSNGEMEYAYLETPGLGTHFIELVRPSARILENFAQMRARSEAFRV